MKKKKGRIRPFRIMAVFLFMVAMTMITRFPKKAVSLERQRAQLDTVAEQYYELQSEYNQLNAELLEINTADFVERTARREYGYCWYGETIYEVGNLDQVQEDPGFDVYSEEETNQLDVK